MFNPEPGIADRLSASLGHCSKLRRRRTAAKRAGDFPGYLYLIACHEYVKIGLSANANLRLSSLQTGCPYELTLLAKWRCKHPGHQEERLHAFFSRFHHRGEWFKVPQDILSVVSKLPDITEL